MRVMKLWLIIAVAVVAGCANPSFAEPSSAASVSRHRLAECMSRRMAASRTLSYYAAQALCEDQLKAQERLRTQEGLKAQNDKMPTPGPLTSISGR
jgi:hypothetical protein